MRTDRSVKSLSGLRRLARPHTKSELDFNFVLADRVGYMNPAHWDELAAGQSLFLSRAFREAMEREGPRAVRSRYGLIYRKDTPVAAVLANIVRLPEDRGMPDSADSRRGSITMIPGASDEPGELRWEIPARNVMVCGDFYAGGFHGIALRDDSELGRLWPAITTLLHKIQLQEGHSRERDYILLKDVPTTFTADTRSLRQCQYRREDASPNMVLSLSPRWKTYEDYLAHLNVRYRLCAVRAARDIARLGYTLRPLADIEPWAARMHELYLNVQRRSGDSYLPLPQNFLPALAERLGDGLFRCTALFNGAELMGFTITLKDRDIAVCYCNGWDTEACRRAPVLPSLLHAVVADALSMGCRKINFGRTALRVKAQLGAHPEQTELWVRHARPDLELSLPPLLDTLSHAPYGDQATPLPI